MPSTTRAAARPDRVASREASGAFRRANDPERSHKVETVANTATALETVVAFRQNATSVRVVDQLRENALRWFIGAPMTAAFRFGSGSTTLTVLPASRRYTSKRLSARQLSLNANVWNT